MLGKTCIRYALLLLQFQVSLKGGPSGRKPSSPKKFFPVFVASWEIHALIGKCHAKLSIMVNPVHPTCSSYTRVTAVIFGNTILGRQRLDLLALLQGVSCFRERISIRNISNEKPKRQLNMLWR